MASINSLVADSSTDGSNDIDLSPSATDDSNEYDNLINNILNIRNGTKDIKEKFTRRNHFYEEKVNDKMKMNLTYEKEFKDHLQKKLNKLDNRLNILQMKYNSYKLWYDRFNIMIIFISSFLSIFEALRNEVDDKIRDNESLTVFFNMVPIGISSTITCSAAIIKFKKYQEKMENMQFTREKVILAISKLKYVQESLWFNGDEEFGNIKQKYLDDVYLIYNESNSELERHIKYSDHHKFYKMYQKRPEKKGKKKKEYL